MTATLARTCALRGFVQLLVLTSPPLYPRRRDVASRSLVELADEVPEKLTPCSAKTTSSACTPSDTLRCLSSRPGPTLSRVRSASTVHARELPGRQALQLGLLAQLGVLIVEDAERRSSRGGRNRRTAAHSTICWCWGSPRMVSTTGELNDAEMALATWCIFTSVPSSPVKTSGVSRRGALSAALAASPAQMSMALVQMFSARRMLPVAAATFLATSSRPVSSNTAKETARRCFSSF